MNESIIIMLKYCLLGFMIVMGVVVIICSIMTIICCVDKFNPIYCFLYERKSWKLWKRVCKEIPNAKFFDHYYAAGHEHLENYKLYISDIGIGKPVYVIYWVASNCASVSDMDGNCILSDFDEYHSNKAVEIIKKYLPL